MIPTFVTQIIGTIVRIAVVYIAGYLANNGGAVMDEGKITEVVTQVVPVIAVLVWSVWTKYKGRQKLVTAQAAGAPVTEHQVEAIVKSGAAPSVLTPKDEIPGGGDNDNNLDNQ